MGRLPSSKKPVETTLLILGTRLVREDFVQPLARFSGDFGDFGRRRDYHPPRAHFRVR
jgi:hypothetical protein